MKRFALAFLFVCFGSSTIVVGQSSPIQGEFIESSSPLANGGRVTTRSEPGRRVQTTVTIAALPTTPTANRANTGNNNSTPTPIGSNSGSSTRAGSPNSILNGGAATGEGSPADTNRTRYPYPATYPSNSQRVPTSQVGFRAAANPNASAVRVANLPNNSQVNTSRVQYQNNCCAPVQNHCCTPNQVNPVGGLGLRPAPDYAQLQNSNLVPTAAFQQNGFLGGGVQPTLSQPPQAGFQFQPGGTGNVGLGQFGGGGNLGSRSLFSSRSGGAYQPLFPILSMPQGSYLGQGLIGQPEAFVNGQPFRNFFRYLLPF